MSNLDRPVVLLTVTGSATSYDTRNPSFKILDLDRETMLPVNMHTHALDIDEANLSGTPTWREIHDYKETYGLPDLRPSNFKDLAYRFFRDKALADEFDRNMHAQVKYYPGSSN